MVRMNGKDVIKNNHYEMFDKRLPSAIGPGVAGTTCLINAYHDELHYEFT